MKQIPSELLDVWCEKFEKIFIVPAIPRHNRNWSPGFWSQESIYMGYGKYGYCKLIPMSKDELYLFYLHIDPPFRRKGLGRRFMKKLIELSQDLNYKRILLDVGYLDPKDKVPIPILRKFYSSLGFKKEKGTRMVLEIN